MTTILIVDDDYMSRELLQAHMENAGYQVLLANGGNKALAIAASEHPDVILMDVRMPDLTGYEVCAILKGKDNTRTIPVLLMTALDTPQTIAAGTEAGADGFVSKPFDVSNLFSQISRVVQT